MGGGDIRTGTLMGQAEGTAAFMIVGVAYIYLELPLKERN